MKFKYIFILSLLLNAVTIIYAINKLIFKYNQAKIKSPPVVRIINNNYIDSLPQYKTDILFIGDSETAYFMATEMFNDIRIKNRGIGGQFTSDILRRLPKEIKGQPAKIFLQGGINDINHLSPVSGVIANYKKMVVTIKSESPSTKIYINSVFPSLSYLGDSIRKCNTALRELCQHQKIQFIDNYTTMAKDGAISPSSHVGDYIHLNYKGYQIWKKNLYPYITAK